MYDLNDSPLLSAWTPYRGKFTLLARILLFILVIYAANMLASIPSSIATIFVGFEDLAALFESIANQSLSQEAMADQMYAIILKLTSHPVVLAFSMLGSIFTALGIIIYTWFVERRPMRSIGLVGGVKPAVLPLLAGIGIGAVLPSVAVGANVLLGAAEVRYDAPRIGWLPLLVVAYLVQAFVEELLYRGYFLSLFLRHGRSPWFGILFISLFNLISYIGTSITAFGFINAALLGLLLTVLTLRTGSIWLSTGVSALWSIVTSLLFGSSQLPTIMRVFVVENHDLVNGGSAGIQAGLVMTLTLLIALAAALFIPSWKRSTRPDFTVFMP